MRRRRRSSRWLAAVLAIAAVSGASFTFYRLRDSVAAPTPLAIVDSGQPAVDPPPVRVEENTTGRPLFTGNALLGMTRTPGEPVSTGVRSSAAGEQLVQLPVAAVPATQPATSSQPVAPAGIAAKPAVEAPATRPTAVIATASTRPSETLAAKPTTLPGNLTGDALVDAKSLVDAHQLVLARSLLSEALRSGKLNEADTHAAKVLAAGINQELVFGRRYFADDPHQASYTMQFGDRLQKVAQNYDIPWELVCRLNGISDPKKVRAGQAIKIIKGPFHAVVRKSAFTMDLYIGSPGEAGSVYITSFPVGLGKDDSTPPGTWMVEPQRKLKNPTYYSPRGEGVIAAGDPRNPLGDYWIGLTGIDGQAVGKISYGIHGTIEPDTIGKMESMGCIRLRNEDVAVVFDLLMEGKSTVIVRD